MGQSAVCRLFAVCLPSVCHFVVGRGAADAGCRADGAAFGGGNSTSAFGATGATSFFGKLTYAAAAIFMISSVWLTVLSSQEGEIGLSDKLKQATDTSPPSAAPTAEPTKKK